MRVIFLDYDGVVNTPQWVMRNGKWMNAYGFPWDNKVNDAQAVQWVSEFCEKYGYSIVVSSTWRFDDNYIECLRNGGLRETVDILGRTPMLRVEGCRGDEIGQWLSEHPDVEQYLIFDDESDMGEHTEHLVLCTSSTGFRQEEFGMAEELHRLFINQQKSSEIDMSTWNRCK